MTPRSIRRAAERKRQKLARKAERAAAAAASAGSPSSADSTTPVFAEAACDNTLCLGDPDTHEIHSISEAQLLANRANAQFSTGPKTSSGKASSSLNAVKTALTGRTVLLPSDDVAEYQCLTAAFADELRPVGVQERELVQSIADSVWRMRRIPCLEMAIFAKGYIEFEGCFDQYDPLRRSALIERETFLKYEKQLRNLQLQEARLARRKEKEMAELRNLQEQRKANEAEALDAAAKQYLLARNANVPFASEQNGFEFSTAEIECYLGRCTPAKIAQLSASPLHERSVNDSPERKQAYREAA